MHEDIKDQQKKLKAKFDLLWAIRTFFEKQNFQDVLTPPMVKNPGMETHIHPFKVTGAHKNCNTDWYLQTSPEFHMKELMSLGFGNIFTICWSFRDEPEAENHRPQFLMLEWYRKSAHYTKIMDDCEGLFQTCLNILEEKNNNIDQTLKHIQFQRASVQDIFMDVLKIDILNFLDKRDLAELIRKDFKDVPLPVLGEDLSWDDYYFLLFLNKIEPELVHYPYLLLSEFPYHLSALSTLKKEDPRVCERFEIYCRGLELCNCFNELTNLNTQKERFQAQAIEKKKLYGYELPEPHVLYSSMERGLPESSGIAMGIERFLKVLTGTKDPF